MEVRSAINILFSKIQHKLSRVFLYLFVVTAIVIAIAASAVMPTFNEVIKKTPKRPNRSPPSQILSPII
ncbi:MAG: hypothetical protein L6V85_09060 [Clostridiales bacterium]|nr:MAG: hypothetical protein L6V85_09060 [Clostridiales bacterium]